MLLVLLIQIFSQRACFAAHVCFIYSVRNVPKMLLKCILAFVLLWQTIYANNYNCSRRSATLLLKRSTYEFSMKILQRVAYESDGHFVFSPLSSWLQLVSLAEGAKGRSLREIWRVTRHHRNRCFKRKLSTILYQMNRDLRFESRRRNLIIVDKVMGVKQKFIREVQKLYGTKVLLCDFNDPSRSAGLVNKIVTSLTNGKISEIVYYDDFINTLLLMSDAAYFRNAWRYPFNTVHTKRQPFYLRNDEKLGDVLMMNQMGYFNITEFPMINARVLELPCMDGRFSMLVFLPIRDMWVGDMFHSLQKTQLSSIFNMYKRQGVRSVNVSLPRFEIKTNVENIPELLYDMGVKSVFDPDRAEFGRISDFKLHASLITQTSDIEVTEKGVWARESPGFLVADNKTINYVANRPFAFMIVDRPTEFILFAGVYSSPSIY